MYLKCVAYNGNTKRKYFCFVKIISGNRENAVNKSLKLFSYDGWIQTALDKSRVYKNLPKGVTVDVIYKLGTLNVF